MDNNQENLNLDEDKNISEKPVNTSEITNENKQEAIDDTTKFLSAIGYLGFLCLLPLLLKRDSKFAQFHGKQSLILAIIWYVFSFFNFIFALHVFINIAYLIIIIIYGYTASIGKYSSIPFIYDLSKKLKF